MSDRVLSFAVMTIGSMAKKLGVSPWEMKDRLERVELIDNYIIECYDTLHTESLDSASDLVLEALNNYESEYSRRYARYDE